MPRHRYRTLMNTMLRKAVMETLEQRKLLTTLLTDTDPTTAIPNDAVFEFKSFSSGVTRIHVHGDISAEFIFGFVGPGSGIAVLGEPTPVGSPLDGTDIYHIYVAESTVDSYIAIAHVPDPSVPDRPMQPFQGSVPLTVVNAQPGPVFVGTSTPGGSGDAWLGARTRLTIPNGINRPIMTATFSGLGIAPQRIANGSQLVPGLTVETGQDMGGFLFGGGISGVVSIDASIDTFYCGALLTGETEGVSEATESVVPNFGVSGDMRNLFVGGSIGTTTGGNRDTPSYVTAFKGRVRGTVNQIKAESGGADGSIYGQFEIEHHPNAARLNLHQREIEDRTPRSGSASLFEEGILGGNARFFNDTFANPQYLSGFTSRTLGPNAIQLHGNVQANPDIDDFVDFYGVPMMAGQTITVRQISTIGTNIGGVIFASTSDVNVGIFDPDNRLVATDYSKKDFEAIEGQPFQFTADRPGVYRIAVAPSGVSGFSGPPSVLRTYSYQLQVLGNGDLAMGGIAASGHIFQAQGTSDQIVIERGDMGAVAARTGISSEGGFSNFVTATSQITVLGGDLRDVDAPSLGFTTGPSGDPNDPENPATAGQGSDAVTLAVAGSVGLVRAAGTGTNDTLLIVMGGEIFTSLGVPAGLNVQMVDAATTLGGSVAANGSIGAIRAANVSYQSGAGPGFEIRANFDGIGTDGFIDLIDVTGQFGTLQGGGPPISTGQGGNVRYIHVGGTVFIDSTFGGGLPIETQYQQGEAVPLTDDSGAAIVLTPTIDRVRNVTTGVITDNSGTLTVTAYPIGGSGGVAVINVTSTRGVTVQGTSFTRGSTVEIGTIEAQGVGANVIVDRGRDRIANTIDDPRGPDNIRNTGDEPLILDPSSTLDNTVLLVGDTEVDVLEVRGVTNNFNQIRNRSPNGEIPIVNVTGSIGRLESTRLGFGKPLRTGGALLPRATIRGGDAFPFLQQTTGINTTRTSDVFSGDIVEVFATQGIGNLNVDGHIQNLHPNTDGRFVPRVFEGIVGPIVTNGPVERPGEIRNVNIGEGIAPGGNGNLSRAGIFANGRLYDVSNQGPGSDVRGDIVSHTGINNIVLKNGAFINADVLVVVNFSNAREFGSGVTLPTATGAITDPVFAIDNIVTTGIGGMMATQVSANDINNMSIGGFGIFGSLIQLGPVGRLNQLLADGYGIRDVTISGGSSFGRVEALGRGNRVSTLAFTPSVRLSEIARFDPYTGQPTGRLADLHSFLGTSKKSPRRKGFSNTGTMDEVLIAFSRNGDLIRAQTIKNSEFNIANTTDTISVRDYVDTLAVKTGKLSNFITGTDVFRSELTVSGPVGRVGIGATWKGTSSLNAIGPNGSIDLFATGRALFGEVIGNFKVGTIQVGTDLGSPRIYSGGDLNALIVDGNILPGANVRVLGKINLLAVGGNIEDNATITTDRIVKRQIGGTIFGDIIIV